jgi:hypothetical protein
MQTAASPASVPVSQPFAAFSSMDDLTERKKHDESANEANTYTRTVEEIVSEPAIGALEDLLSKVEALPQSIESFELFVPQDLTWRGQPVALNPAMAIVVDGLLGKGLFPDGFEQRATGRHYKYKSDPPR